jgi:hypothetical protein
LIGVVDHRQSLLRLRLSLRNLASNLSPCAREYPARIRDSISRIACFTSSQAIASQSGFAFPCVVTVSNASATIHCICMSGSLKQPRLYCAAVGLAAADIPLFNDKYE